MEIVDSKIDTDGKPRKTSPFLTKYERARLVQDRALKLASGEKPLVETKKGELFDVIRVAMQEIDTRVIEYWIRRRFPNGDYEDVSISYLKDI